MARLIEQLDRILRTNRATPGDEPEPIPIPRLLAYCLALGAIYGVFMGLYSASMRGSEGLMQVAASAIKVPLLFLLTLAVTFPSMYVFSALAGSRLDPWRALSLMLRSMVVTLALAASFAPIVGFFTISTSSYHFMVLLNVVFLACAGLAGVVSLHKSLSRLRPAPNADSAVSADSPAPLTARTSDPALGVFQIWIILYGVVGAQMGWVLRPFIGAPDEPFTWFRERSGHFLAGIAKTALRLMGVEQDF